VETRTQKDFGIFLMVFFFVSRLLSFGPLQRNVKKIKIPLGLRWKNGLKTSAILSSFFFFAKPVYSFILKIQIKEFRSEK